MPHGIFGGGEKGGWIRVKVLIAVVSSDVNHEKLEDILTQFEHVGYRVHVFDKIEEQVELMIDLSTVINYVKDIEKEIERIVILSNISEFIFSWYRCYNSLADDFIYYLDECTNYENIAIIEKIPNVDFYEQLYNFNGIAQEENQGKIYLTIDFTNFRRVYYFLLVNNNFQFFDDYRNFNFEQSNKKIITNKCYRYKGSEYQFITSQDTSNKNIVVIDPENSFQGFRFDEESCMVWRLHYHLIVYLMISIDEMLENDPSKRDTMLLMIFQNIKLQDDNAKNYLYRCFTAYFGEINILFYTKIRFISLLVALGVKENIYYTIMQLLLDDHQHIEKHYPLLVSSLRYHSQEGILYYKNIYHDREQELTKIINFYNENMVVNFLPMRKKNRIIIHVTQLLVLQHSPTLWTLNYAKYLKKYYPEYEIQIFVDDIFLYHSNEVAFPYVVFSEPSIKMREIHEEFLKELDITIYYSDYTKGRRERLQEDLEQIYNFSPDIILGLSTEFSIIRGILYDNYPIIDLTLGGLSNSQYADVFMHSYEQSNLEQECNTYNYNRKNLSEGKVVRYQIGLDFPEPHKKLTREEYNISQEDFVMITVGNRLDGEIDDSFIDMICSLLTDKPNVKWVIVGKANLFYLKEKYSILVEQQIVFINFEDELAALYRICDIYINPFRKTGGYSGAMAMNQELPVVTLNELSDVMTYVGVENSVVNIEEYIIEVNRLYEDASYRTVKGKLMKQRIEQKFSFKNAVDNLVYCFGKALDQFNKRKDRIR